MFHDSSSADVLHVFLFLVVFFLKYSIVYRLCFLALQIDGGTFCQFPLLKTV